MGEKDYDTLPGRRKSDLMSKRDVLQGEIHDQRIWMQKLNGTLQEYIEQYRTAIIAQLSRRRPEISLKDSGLVMSPQTKEDEQINTISRRIEGVQRIMQDERIKLTSLVDELESINSIWDEEISFSGTEQDPQKTETQDISFSTKPTSDAKSTAPELHPEKLPDEFQDNSHGLTGDRGDFGDVSLSASLLDEDALVPVEEDPEIREEQKMEQFLGFVLSESELFIRSILDVLRRDLGHLPEKGIRRVELMLRRRNGFERLAKASQTIIPKKQYEKFFYCWSMDRKVKNLLDYVQNILIHLVEVLENIASDGEQEHFYFSDESEKTILEFTIPNILGEIFARLLEKSSAENPFVLDELRDTHNIGYRFNSLFRKLLSPQETENPFGVRKKILAIIMRRERDEKLGSELLQKSNLYDENGELLF